MECVFEILDVNNQELKTCKLCKKEIVSRFPPEKIHAKCIKQEQTEPKIVQKAVNLLSAARDFVSDGMSLVDKEEYTERLRICGECESCNEKCVCLLCGCNMKIKAMGRVMKCPFKSEEFPNGKWPTSDNKGV